MALNDSTPINQPATPFYEMAESLSQVMVALLERRYLSDFKPTQWTIRPTSVNNNQVFLREVMEVGKDNIPEQMFGAVPYILSACHDPGYTFISTFFGSGTRQHIYLGGKRTIGQTTNRSASDFLSGVYSAFKSFNGGLVLDEPHTIQSGKYQPLHDFINSAKFFSVITGIPSGRNGVFSLNFQGLDRLSRAAGNGEYVFNVVAEPVRAQELDSMLDNCRKIRSEIHSFIKKTRSYGETTQTSVQVTERDTSLAGGWKQNAPKYLMGAALFLQATQLIPGVRPLVSLIQLLQTGGMQLLAQSRIPDSSQKHITDSSSESHTQGLEVLDAHAEAVDQLISEHIKRLQSARGNGWWNVAIYIAATNSEVLNNVTGAIKSICSGDKTYLDPIREIKITPSLIKEAMINGSILAANPILHSDVRHPVGDLYNCLSTCLNSDELSILAHVPVKEIPGLTMRGFSKFSLSVQESDGESVYVGDLYNGIDQQLTPLNISLKSLNLHALITGMPGFGKTTTCMQIITEAYLKHSVPFLVIEPAKKEYRQMAQMEQLLKHLRVYSIDINSPTPLRLNPFEFQAGISLSKHLDMLKAVFNASFPMFAGMSYVLEDAILAVYQERGWNIFTSNNAYIADNDLAGRRVLMPTLTDLQNKIEEVLSEKKYGMEIHQNLSAALRSRIGSLTVGTKGLVLNCQLSSPIREMMTQPTVIELQDLGDDQEKAFVMALLLVNLYEYAELRQRDVPNHQRDRLQHLTLVEEAHRLLSGRSGQAADEAADPRGKAVSMFTDMLAEVRAYGEGLLIADQIPTKLAPEILKNTNLKIIHRLNAPDDRHVVGRSINLNEAQSDYLNNLPPLYAVVHDAGINDAVMIRSYPFKAQKLVRATPQEDEMALRKLAQNTDLFYLKRHAGCTSCTAPCTFYHHQETLCSQVDETSLIRLLDALHLQDFGPAATLWLDTLSHIREKLSVQQQDKEQVVKGIIFCLLVNAFYRNDSMKIIPAVKNKSLAENKLKVEHRMILLSALVYQLIYTPNKVNQQSLETFKLKIGQIK